MLQVTRPAAGHKPQEKAKQHSAEASNDDRIDQAARSGVAEILHDKAADHSA